ncbi:MAG: type I restriction endonuclease [Bacteroidales bacterium]|nr:type I restriction endonuclease [Bacteroidales bacterium]
MAKDYSEDLLIQKSTAELLEKELGWKSVYAFDNEVLGEQGTLGRKSQSEVVLTRHLRMALKRLNPWMNDKQLTEAVERMTSYMSSQTLMQTIARANHLTSQRLVLLLSLPYVIYYGGNFQIVTAKKV